MNYKWFVGIDISKKTLDVVLYKKELQKKSPHCQVANNSNGFNKLIKWLIEQNVKLKDTSKRQITIHRFAWNTLAFMVWN